MPDATRARSATAKSDTEEQQPSPGARRGLAGGPKSATWPYWGSGIFEYTMGELLGAELLSRAAGKRGDT